MTRRYVPPLPFGSLHFRRPRDDHRPTGSGRSSSSVIPHRHDLPAERDPMSDSLSLPGGRGRRLVVGAMALSMLLATSSVADAAYTYTNTTRMYACVNNSTKVARIVLPRNGSRACKTGETLVSWLRQGAKGPAGPAGATGAAGATGPQGPAGATGAA